MENSNTGRPVPATDEIVDKLPREVLEIGCMFLATCPRIFTQHALLAPTLDKDCAVCKDQFTLETDDPDEQIVITLPCNHPFHSSCILPWLKSSGTCPVCRYVNPSLSLSSCLSRSPDMRSCHNRHNIPLAKEKVGPQPEVLLHNHSYPAQGRQEPQILQDCFGIFSIALGVLELVAGRGLLAATILILILPGAHPGLRMVRAATSLEAGKKILIDYSSSNGSSFSYMYRTISVATL